VANLLSDNGGNMPASTGMLCNLRTLLCDNRFSTCLAEVGFAIASEYILEITIILA
jgi:hypothetical protein